MDIILFLRSKIWKFFHSFCESSPVRFVCVALRASYHRRLSSQQTSHDNTRLHDLHSNLFDPMGALFYSSRLSVVGSVSHSVAILCTIFRLAYRGWMHHLWWEDAWAAFALIGDVICLACIWLDRRKSFWILTVAFTSVQWAARMSVIFSIIRVTNHSNFKVHRQITYIIAVSFACMWVVLLVHRITLCAYHSCRMGKSVAFSILITDVIADFVLVVTPLKLWRNAGLSRSTKILVLSSFSSSILITAVTIPHSIILIKIRKVDMVTIIFAHVKSALSLVVCNLLVIVTFVYRVCWKETFDLDQPITSCGVLTSVIFIQMPCATNSGTLIVSEDGDTETAAMSAKTQDESVVYVEEGTGTQAEY